MTLPVELPPRFSIIPASVYLWLEEGYSLQFAMYAHYFGPEIAQQFAAEGVNE